MLSAYLATLESDTDQALFAQFYQQYLHQMTKVARKILPSHAQAEDAVHDAFLKMIQHFEELKEIPEPQRGYWMITVTKHASLDLLRKGKKEMPMEEDTAAVYPAVPADEGGFRALVAVIRAMPETYRRVLELRFVAEWSHAEIARELRISEGAVKSRVFRGRQILIERMAKEGYCCE